MCLVSLIPSGDPERNIFYLNFLDDESEGFRSHVAQGVCSSLHAAYIAHALSTISCGLTFRKRPLPSVEEATILFRFLLLFYYYFF